MAELEQDNHTWTLKLSTRASVHLADPSWLANILEQAIAANIQTLVIDLSAVATIDSRGLRALMHINRQLHQHNIQVVLTNPNNHLKRVFRIMQFERIFTIT